MWAVVEYLHQQDGGRAWICVPPAAAMPRVSDLHREPVRGTSECLGGTQGMQCTPLNSSSLSHDSNVRTAPNPYAGSFSHLVSYGSCRLHTRTHTHTHTHTHTPQPGTLMWQLCSAL